MCHMTIEEFSIGKEFRCGGRRWRGTEIGKRGVPAVHVEPHEITAYVTDQGGERQTRRYASDDSSLFKRRPTLSANWCSINAICRAIHQCRRHTDDYRDRCVGKPWQNREPH